MCQTLLVVILINIASCYINLCPCDKPTYRLELVFESKVKRKIVDNPEPNMFMKRHYFVSSQRKIPVPNFLF